jgi:hypothetical protein
VRLLLPDPLRKLGGVVAQRFIERNFEFERNLLTLFVLGLGRSELLAHGFLLDLLTHRIAHFTFF